ncbi:hypothetical protein [Streptomyces sp. NPDC001282]|uniref:hypothetical protein n=1 Tax=Streptomyces sp. NPDC001282 TaxID=3364557 RepID=UPI0036CD4D25
MATQEAAAELPPQDDTEAVERPRLTLVKEPVTEETTEPAVEEERRGRAAEMCAELGAYLPTPRNLRVLLAGVGEGTGVLVGRGWAWLRGEAWDSDSAMRAGGVVFVCYAAGTAALEQFGTYTGYLIPPAVAVWCLVARQHTELAVAVRAATKEAKAAERERLLKEAREEIAKKAAEAAEARIEAKRRAQEDLDGAKGQEDVADAAAQDQGEDGGELTVDDIAAVIRRVAARHPHHLGVHLSDLLPEPELEGWEQAELKTALQDDWGLPVSSFKLTFPGKRARTREGVRLEHLPAAPATTAGAAGGRAPSGVGEGLAPVPSQPPAGARSSTPASTPSEAHPSTPSGVASGAAVSPSPAPATSPSQGAG